MIPVYQRILNSASKSKFLQCFHIKVQFNSHISYYSVKDIYLSKDSIGHKAEVKGWVKAVRKMKDNVFIDLDDGSWPEKLQVVIPKSVVPKNLTYGSSVELSGKLLPNQLKKVELVLDDIKVVGPCVVADGYPFAPRKSYSADYVRQYIHLRPRTRILSSLLRIRHGAALALHQYFNGLGYCKIDVPVLTSNDCEGAGEVFIVKPDSEKLIREMGSPGMTPEEAFFNGKTYLTVSGQLHLEIAARAMGKVYCLGPTFRAENSRSRLHLSEFYMAEAELAFVKDLDSILKLMEGLIKTMCQTLMDTCAEDVHLFVKTQGEENCLNIEHLLKSPFTVDSYDNVFNVIDNHRSLFTEPLKKGDPLSKEHELFLVKHNNNLPIFVVDWPTGIKPFYMKAHTNDSSKVHAVDLLCTNVGELCGGSLREDDFDTLVSKLKTHDLEDNLGWYLELRKFGNVPTGGFGMGFERFLQVILGIPNIKDAIPFPRWPHNCKL
ncbi:probable asparagine--tRNA ligase, mitochondrial [Homalodisca vitripennis]|uniref:probable asparagine--tRNA ligase, mitochondrial n=1 Tax=Homalodisca vitripennis TaxID=197043 RepID=UPI001EEBB7D1|nr:probable asparagine--tRNA ligase, mitochondrial [Homalodisca vitripennis]